VTESSSPEDEPLMTRVFVPYATAIGFLLREWNDLQDALADLFVTIFGIRDGGLALAVWHAIPSDRLQRRMLRDLASYLFKPTESTDLDATQRANAVVWKEIEWILTSADSLGAKRDAAAHSPVALLLSEPIEFIAHHLHGNPSAKTLKGKNLLAEFKLYQDRAATLHHHADQIEYYLRQGRRHTLPKRPSWPERPGKKKGA
jgi:hypothetical protein